uniref:Uncharacterized protein n=1 Tax=Myotis myotis TaxID=51298 RepID=A0A7J7SBV8_MYOMY|nr:hypothetical protein mMyoMyo1_009522 [Myotis myotis]
MGAIPSVLQVGRLNGRAQGLAFWFLCSSSPHPSVYGKLQPGRSCALATFSWLPWSQEFQVNSTDHFSLNEVRFASQFIRHLATIALTSGVRHEDPGSLEARGCGFKFQVCHCYCVSFYLSEPLLPNP